MVDLCKYKDIFGKPKEGIHSYRIFNISIVDVLLVFIIAWLISYIFKISFIITSFVLFILGIVVHRLFCVKSTVDILLFGN